MTAKLHVQIPRSIDQRKLWKEEPGGKGECWTDHSSRAMVRFSTAHLRAQRLCQFGEASVAGSYPSFRVFRNSMMSASSCAVIAGASPRCRLKGGSLTSTL